MKGQGPVCHSESRSDEESRSGSLITKTLSPQRAQRAAEGTFIWEKAKAAGRARSCHSDPPAGGEESGLRPDPYPGKVRRAPCRHFVPQDDSGRRKSKALHVIPRTRPRRFCGVEATRNLDLVFRTQTFSPQSTQTKYPDQRDGVGKLNIFAKEKNQALKLLQVSGHSIRAWFLPKEANEPNHATVCC